MRACSRSLRVVALGVARQHVGEHEGLGPVRELLHRAALVRPHHHDQRGRLHHHLELEVGVDVAISTAARSAGATVGRARGPGGRGRAERRVGEGLGDEQVAIHRVAQVVEVEPAEQAVPVGAVALGAIQLARA